MTISNLNYKILILTSSSSSPDFLGIVGSSFTTSTPEGGVGKINLFSCDL